MATPIEMLSSSLLLLSSSSSSSPSSHHDGNEESQSRHDTHSLLLSPTVSSTSTSTCTYHHHHYDARDVAIRLNNVGVALLQQARYIYAAETFRDALYAMKLATATTTTDTISGHSDDERNVRLVQKMADGEQRLRQCYDNPSLNTFTNRHHDLSILPYDGTITEAIADAAIGADVFDDTPSSSTEATGGGSQANNKRFAIHIDSNGNFHRNDGSLEIHTAIILYNFGISFRCLVNAIDNDDYQKSNDQDRNDMMNNSKRLFLLSYDILYHLASLHDNNSQSSNDDNQEHAMVLLLSCLVIMALFQQSMDAPLHPPRDDEAFRYFLLIRRLRWNYIILHHSHHQSPHHIVDTILRRCILQEIIGTNGQQHAAAA